MRGRSLKIALAVSLVLNILVVGAIAGAAIRWQRGDVARWVAVRQIGRLRAAAATLQPQNRRAYYRALRVARRDGVPLVSASLAARREAAAAFAAPRFDPAAVTVALARARTADFALRARAEAAVVGVAATLPPDERRRLAEGLRRSGPLRLSLAGPASNQR